MTKKYTNRFFFSFQKKDCNSTIMFTMPLFGIEFALSKKKKKLLRAALLMTGGVSLRILNGSSQKMFSACLSKIYRAMLFIQTVL